MKNRRRTARRINTIIYSTALFLVFIASFGWLFYFLQDQSESFEREKVNRDVHIVTLALQTLLLENERFFSNAARRIPDGGASNQAQCQTYLGRHPEIVLVTARNAEGAVQWKTLRDSTAVNVDGLSAGRGGHLVRADESGTGQYSNAYQWGREHVFELRIPFSQGGIFSGTLSAYFSAERLLRALLQRVPMPEYEISVLSASGQTIASTGYSNAVAMLRVQRPVEGYSRLLTVDLANAKYLFWTSELLVGAILCGALCVAVFVITFYMRRDVTKLKTTESSLRASEERFRAIFENSADAMRLMDRYGRIVMVNSAYCDLVKSSHEDLLREYNTGNNNLEERYGANAAFQTQFDAGTLKMPTSQLMERRVGEKIPVEVSHSFIKLGKDEKLLLSIFRDVSERRKHELEAQQVQKMDALGAFAVGIGNNLKNIVGIVTNSAEVISKQASGNQVLTQYVEMIIRESMRASELADDLLVFARSKSGEEKPISAEKILGQVQKMLEHMLSPSIALSVTLNDRNAVVKGDIHQMHQAIVNLALDAQRRMPRGGALSIESAIADPEFIKQRRSAADQKEFIVINVVDNGKELDEYSRRRIFEPFFNAKTTDYTSGLRLSVTYGIVQNHGGLIDVKSEKGRGTTFSLYFPVLYHEETAEQEKAAEVPRGGNECILVVDDEESFRQIYEHGLTDLGYRVYAAEDGETAFALYEKKRSEIDLVISDLMMPKVNGEELYRKLRTLNPAVKFVLVTGAIDLKAKEEFLKTGVREIVMKPFSLDEFMGTVRKTLDAR